MQRDLPHCGLVPCLAAEQGFVFVVINCGLSRARSLCSLGTSPGRARPTVLSGGGVAGGLLTAECPSLPLPGPRCVAWCPAAPAPSPWDTCPAARSGSACRRSATGLWTGRGLCHRPPCRHASRDCCWKSGQPRTRRASSLLVSLQLCSPSSSSQRWGAVCVTTVRPLSLMSHVPHLLFTLTLPLMY